MQTNVKNWSGQMNEKIENIIERLKKHLEETRPQLVYALTCSESKPIEDLELGFLDVYLLLYYIENLKHKLQVKGKVINEILDFAFDKYCPYECFCDEEKEECSIVKKICNCNNCKKNYRKCWLKYFENKILERGKKC